MFGIKNLQPARAWTMYSLGVVAFLGTIAPAILPAYFESIATPELSLTQARALWAYAVALSLLLVVVLAPILGGFADRTGGRKRLLFIATVIGALTMGAMFFVGRGHWWIILGLYVTAAVSTGCGTFLFDSLLVHVVEPQEYDRTSSQAYFNEFLGTALTLVISLLVIMVVFPGSSWGPRIAFLLMGIWWAVFGFLSLQRLPEPPALTTEGVLSRDNTLKVKPGQLILFLLAIGLSNGGIATINRMATSIGGEIGIGTKELIGALVLRSMIGALFMWLLSRVIGHFKVKKLIETGLVLFSLVSFLGYFMLANWIFWVLAAGAGIAQGMVIALSRSFFCRMAPRARSSQFFGFYYMALFLPAIFGPLAFAQAGLLLDSTRLGILIILVMFILGRMILTFVDDEVKVSPSKQEAGFGESGISSQLTEQTVMPESD